MAWVKLYERIGWENVPSTKSPINDLNLNKIDIAVDAMDDRVIELQTTKAEQTDLLTSVKDVDINQTTGVITITFNNNTTKTFDTVLEKVVTNFRYDATTQSLILTLADGTTQSIPLSEFITQNEFLNSDRITFSVSEGKVRADLIKGSITGDYLQPNYLADITAQASLAGASATAAATSEANAAQSAQTASTKATEASQSATTASTKADEASASATTASSKATEATTAAQTATTKASEASTSAQTATTKATEAATSASNASTSETNAQNSATTATTKAAEASASADRAEQAAQSTEGVVKWSERKGYVGKNLLENKATSQTINGVTFTVNDDKSVTVNGTASADIQYVLNTNMVLEQNTYKLSGVANGALATCYISVARIRKSDGNKAQSAAYYNTPVQLVVDNDDYLYEFRLTTTRGNAINNLTFYPMIRYASIADDTYEPYLPDNKKLAERMDDIEGYENLLPNNVSSIVMNGYPREINGLIFEQLADGKITVNGTASADTTVYVVTSVKPQDLSNTNEPNNTKFRLKENGLYFFSGSNGGSETTYQLIINRQVIDRNYQKINYGIDYGNGVVFNQTDNDGEIAVAIRIFSGFVCDNLAFEPMIIKGAARKPYKPYKWYYAPMFRRVITPYNLTAGELLELEIKDIPEDMLIVGFININTDTKDVVAIKQEIQNGRKISVAIRNISAIDAIDRKLYTNVLCINRRPWEY